MNLVVGRTKWAERVYLDDIASLPGDWSFVSSADELEAWTSEETNVRRIYFLHWSRKVPKVITERFECINFHMTDLPYGRGGSPLQNLILNGHSETVLTAIRMDQTLDGGPIYLKRRLELHGTAEAIYGRATRLAAQMISEIEGGAFHPAPQVGPVTQFKRRGPEMSLLPENPGLVDFYDFVRMLDAEGYPRAFINLGNLRVEFSRAVMYSNHIAADAIISSPDWDTK